MTDRTKAKCCLLLDDHFSIIIHSAALADILPIGMVLSFLISPDEFPVALNYPKRC